MSRNSLQLMNSLLERLNVLQSKISILTDSKQYYGQLIARSNSFLSTIKKQYKQSLQLQTIEKRKVSTLKQNQKIKNMLDYSSNETVNNDEQTIEIKLNLVQNKNIDCEYNNLFENVFLKVNMIQGKVSEEADNLIFQHQWRNQIQHKCQILEKQDQIKTKNYRQVFKKKLQT